MSTSNNPLGIPPYLRKDLEYTGNEMEFQESLLSLVSEKMVDFEGLKANNFDVEPYFIKQGWKRYFEMLNGPIYPELLRHFWMKAKIFTKYEAKQEEKQAIERNPSLKGKSRKEMGLIEFTGTQIRSNICGLNLIYSKEHFNKLLNLDDKGLILDAFEKDTRYRDDLCWVFVCWLHFEKTSFSQVLRHMCLP
ncbi:cullin-like protein [Trifolium pratense]|uniref:Cullin-like protein n=1 Tax=Trifolium pratense TaxID=57577 RepID=A0A2K3JKL0_TRIPR|nr:cullin-like protein [Trifolium pratense]